MKPTTVLIAALLLISIVGMAQKGDSIHTKGKDSIPVKKDTVRVPLILIQKTDSLAVTILYEGPGHTVSYQHGYYLYTGLKYPDGSWAQTPTSILVDDRYQKFKPIPIAINQRSK